MASSRSWIACFTASRCCLHTTCVGSTNLGRSGHYWVRRGRQPLLPLRRHNRYRRGSATAPRAQDVSDDRSCNQQSIADRMRIVAFFGMPSPSRSTPYSAVSLSVNSTTSGCSMSESARLLLASRGLAFVRSATPGFSVCPGRARRGFWHALRSRPYAVQFESVRRCRAGSLFCRVPELIRWGKFRLRSETIRFPSMPG